MEEVLKRDSKGCYEYNYISHKIVSSKQERLSFEGGSQDETNEEDKEEKEVENNKTLPIGIIMLGRNKKLL